jgi:predicted ribosome quality control (RQC) complex YloA/Tae2 family protein
LTLDTWLVARLARELDDALAGARVQGLSSSAAGLKLSCYRRGGPVTLRVSLDPDGPMAAAIGDDGAVNENGAGGWAGGVAPLLRGCTVDSVQAVPNDRIIYVGLRSRSAFGVPSRYRLVLELEPLKANALILRPSDGDAFQILAANKQIRGQEGARSIQIGESYEAPPSRRPPRDANWLEAEVEAADPSDARVLARMLGEYDRACTQPLAREVVARASASVATDRVSARALIDLWTSLRSEVEQAAAGGASPVFYWMRGDLVATCHLVRLSWPPGQPSTAATCNECCVMQLKAIEQRKRAPLAGRLRKRLATMLQRYETEAAGLRRTQDAAREAEAFRIAGEAIYSYLAQIPERAERFVTPDGVVVALDATKNAKENAAAYFKRFKKAKSGLPRVAARLAVLEANRSYWEHLLWELDRAESAPTAELTAVCDEIASGIGLLPRAGTRSTGRPRKLLARTVDLGDGATAHVGRSPKDNERVTFTVAGPNDFWFHARGVPGAHVVLKLARGGERPSDGQLRAAAALAAGQSRASDSAKVDVDYTQRKHVRRRGGGQTGLVWYTDFKTLLVEPRKLPSH